MPQFYGSQRLFWYLIVAVTLNSASIAVLTYFLVERAKAGSTAVYHFLGLFERCLPAWWKERRLEAERQSIAQLVTSAIALSYLLHSLTLISGPALFDDGDPSVRKGGVTSTWPCSLVGGFEQYFGLLSVGCAGFLFGRRLRRTRDGAARRGVPQGHDRYRALRDPRRRRRRLRALHFTLSLVVPTPLRRTLVRR